jgi:hypothetical protein
MQCVECGREREPTETGWVILFSATDEQRLSYCPECFATVLGGEPKDRRNT